MRTVKRAVTAFAASLLLTIGAAALAAPAHAEVDATVLGLLGAKTNGSIDVTAPPGSDPIVELPNFLAPIV
ncbi:hypothetical protein [Streptomyces olivoreticuli]|uniref:hypothetical protein n=1 Tax=Streptomyces olivoreticuli TaxID=68246 RepID=UPI0013C336CC|nr:hypothetical protein [Streptomyces olivoreticuli]